MKDNMMAISKAEDMFHIGKRLSNGAMVLAWRTHPNDGYVILADTNGPYEPYVTWRCFYADAHDTCHGRYFKKLSEAALDLETR
jgi:hypothetical protein